jgi:molybdenum cofactor sulfurtransferase
MSSQEYGYGLGAAAFSHLISEEYPSLKDTVYLDFAGSPPAPPSTVHSFANALTGTLYSNPHSQLSTTAAQIDRIRGRVLRELFGVKNAQDQNWDVVFTAGATAALKLVGESFSWNIDGRSAVYRYIKESHTSLVGIRGCALARGARVESMGLDDIERFVDASTETTLWGYPAQCNVTGSRIGLQLGRELKRRSNGNRHTAVVVDAAAYLSTSILDLGSIPYDEAPDFVACSFYKVYVRQSLSHSHIQTRSEYACRAIRRVSELLSSSAHLHTCFQQPTHMRTLAGVR